MSEDTTPRWRKDFPIEWGADNYVTRREFTKFLVLASGATLVGNGYFVLRRQEHGEHPYPSREIAREDELRPGQVKLFRYPTPADGPVRARRPLRWIAVQVRGTCHSARHRTLA